MTVQGKRYIASTTDQRGRPMYVTHYPGEGGKDWGYGSEKLAKRMPESWVTRFRKHCRDVGCQCSVVEVAQ